MITFLSVPKPFEGPIGIIQCNAIKSWKKLDPECEIFLYGNEKGVKEIAETFNLIHIPNVKKNSFGTPSLGFIFDHVQLNAKNDILCYINSDIILLTDLINAIKIINFPNYLMIGSRINADVTENINFEDEMFDSKLKDILLNRNIQKNVGIDYFVFRKGMYNKIPPFAVGRAGWDNWFVYNSRKLNYPVIDASASVTAIHQNHSYNHVPQKSGPTYGGPESENNVQLGGGSPLYFWNLEDTDWIFTDNRLMKRNINFKLIFRKLIIITPKIFHPLLELVLGIVSIKPPNS